MSAHQRCGTVSGIARIRADGAEGKGGRGYTQENVSMRASMCRASFTTHHLAHSRQATCFRLPYTLSRALCAHLVAGGVGQQVDAVGCE